jgi:hypothetical protein
MVQCVVMMGDELLKAKYQIDLWYSTCEVERICVGHGQCKRLGFTNKVPWELKIALLSSLSLFSNNFKILSYFFQILQY